MNKKYEYEYERPGLTVDVVIYTVKNNKLLVLLIKRDNEPYEDMWAIPGGFVSKTETLDQAAIRELKKETNIEDVYLEQLYSFGDPDRDPRGWIVTVAYYALILSDNLKIKPISHAKEAKWFSVYELPPLAFDHKNILDLALNRLRSKIEYTNIAFQLLPAKFTLTELQKTYELILDKKIDKRNFRKKILSSDILNEFEEYKKDGNYRPAKLYGFKSN